MSTFKYSPLPTSTTIRLVILPPRYEDNTNDKINVQLEEFELSEISKRYYALSYFWGDGNKKYAIRVNDLEFEVTENLMFFLRRKRPYPNHLKYWIDAICINQEDKFEKSSQIPRMAEIYMNALCIHGELGQATKEEEAVVEDMKYLSGFMADEVKRVRSNRELRLPERYLKPYRPEIWENIGAFLGKSWWTRAWVMQEATALSTKDTYLFYGNASLRMLEVIGTNIALHALEMLQPYGSQAGPITRQYRIQRISNIRSFREKNGPRPLLEILDQFRGLDATDKRDIVYAALNLSNDIDLNVFRPDYNKSIFEVYRDVAVYYLDHLPYPLDVLAYCGTRTQYLEIPSETASWIPFWDGRMPLSILRKSYTLSDGTSHRTYDASQGYDTLESSFPRSSNIFQVRGLELILHGFVIDKITSRSSAAITTDTERAIEIVNSWAPMIADMLYFTGETSLDAFLATIATDLAGRKDQYRRGGKAEWKNDRLEIIPEIVTYSLMRCLALTENGYMALVSHQVQVGDIIFLLLGGSVLYVLRPKGDYKFWLIGECYVHGLMDGQAMKWLENGQVSLEEVTVI